MRIAVSAQGDSLESPTSPVFGRCARYLFVDGETMSFEAAPNPAMSQGGGAGIQAAQFIVDQGAQAVLTGNLGPNAFDVLAAAGVARYLVPEGTVRQAVEAFMAGRLEPMGGANVVAHAGLGGGPGVGKRWGTSGSMVRPASTSAGPEPAHASELAALGETLRSLRRQLAETMDKIEKLEQEKTE